MRSILVIDDDASAESIAERLRMLGYEVTAAVSGANDAPIETELLPAHARLQAELSELKRAVEALQNERLLLRTLIDNIPDSMYSKDLECRKTLVNRAELAFLGAASEADVLGRDDYELYPKELADGFFADDQTVMSTGTPVLNREEFILNEKKEKRWLLSSKIPLRDRDNKIVGLVGIGRDITDRKMAEQLVRDMQHRESIGVLTSGIAHDFNNLLGSMMGNVSLAQTHLPSHHPAAGNIEKALTAMERAAELTKQMLAYSGEGKFQIAAIDMAALLREHANMFTVSLPRNVALQTHLPATPVYVNGDPGQIKQILMNLIINAGEAIGESEGSVVVELSVGALEEHDLAAYGRLTTASLKSGEYARLSVRDTGIGMNGETMHKAFDPFFTTKFTGRGLGLSAVLGIIRGHGGGITVDSTEGAGTTVTIVLPAIPPPAAGAAHPDAGTPGALPTGRTILIIDDEMEIASTAQEMLEIGRFTAVIELNPERGIEYYKHHRAEIGLVLLDLTMPVLSGKDVMDALLAFDPDVKIIISSGYSKEDVAQRIGSAAVAGCLQKPYRLQSLLAMVQKVLE